MTTLADRIAVVTGANSGIGRAVSERFSRDGAIVIAVDRAPEIATHPPAGVAESLVCDVVDEGEVRELRDHVRTAYGRWDAVVNSAGTVTSGRAGDLSAANWRQAFEVNVHGTWLVSRAAISVMVGRQEGTIVNISSGAGLRPIDGLAAYSAAKAAVISLTRSIAIEYGSNGIRANCICPGPVDTPMHRGAVERMLGEAADASSVLASYAIKRLGRPDEIAAAVQFLVSPQSGPITGVTLAMDAGRTLH